MRTAAILMLLLLPTSAHSRAAEIEVEYDPDAFVSTIRVRAEDDKVAWADVLRGLARARGHDDTALDGTVPDASFHVTGAKGILVRAGLNVALRPHVHFDLERDEDGEPWLVTRVDRAAMLASKRHFQEWFRNAVVRRRVRGEGQTYGLVLEKNGLDASPDLPLVVLIHGLNSGPEEIEGLLTAVRDAGFACGTFRYPNDQPVADSAKLLAEELAKFTEDHPHRRVSLVTHSMGGLIARTVIEDPRLDPGNVRQLIMIAPPNHGSTLAHFSFGLDVWEYVLNDSRKSRDASLFYAAVEDGLSQAADDLRPGSPLLNHLNARGRNPNVAYSIILGTKAPLTEADLALLQRRLAAAGRQSRWVRFFGSRLQTWLADLDEVVYGKGDGVVSVQRGRLDGVQDVVLLEFGHTSILGHPSSHVAKSVYREVAARLTANP